MEVNHSRAAELIILTEGHEHGWNSNAARAGPACQEHLEARTCMLKMASLLLHL